MKYIALYEQGQGKVFIANVSLYYKIDGKSILKPAVVDWSNRRGYRNVENEDNIEVYIRVR